MKTMLSAFLKTKILTFWCPLPHHKTNFNEPKKFSEQFTQ